jgi:hypothetical protein
MKLGLKKVTKRVFRNFFNSYREKLFNEELIHLNEDEHAESGNKDTELLKMLDAKELSPVFRHRKAAVLVLKENDCGWERSSVRHDLNISVRLLPSTSQSETLAAKATCLKYFCPIRKFYDFISYLFLIYNV